MSGKQRVREILLDLLEKGHGRHVKYKEDSFGKMQLISSTDTVDQALDSIEEVVKEVIGQENEYSRDMPVPDPDPFALPSDHQNQLRRYQLGRWEGNNGQ